jgi:ketosteroid isomerase-like protein
MLVWGKAQIFWALQDHPGFPRTVLARFEKTFPDHKTIDVDTAESSFSAYAERSMAQAQRGHMTVNANAHVEAWMAAWNSHDLDRIMSHYAEDIVFEAQTAARRWNLPDGRIIGKEMLRQHFALGLELSPKLRFTLEDVFLSPSGYAILYYRENGNRVIDAVTLDGNGRACKVIAYYKSMQE